MLNIDCAFRTGYAMRQIQLANAGNSVTDSIIDTMKAIIAEHHLQILDLYPRDLDHDRIVLNKCAVEGATIGWVVGNMHTHLVVLGLEPEQNEMVTCFTNLSASDRFYLIQVRGGQATFTEKTREEFKSLVHHPIPYNRVGGQMEFTLQKGGRRLAYCSLAKVGSYENTMYQVRISSYTLLTALDRAAVEYWCHRAVSVASGSLLTKRELTWDDQPVIVAIQPKALAA